MGLWNLKSPPPKPSTASKRCKSFGVEASYRESAGWGLGFGGLGFRVRMGRATVELPETRIQVQQPYLANTVNLQLSEGLRVWG